MDALKAQIPTGYIVRSGKPITLVDIEPEPDAAVVIGTVRTFADRHPRPAEVAMVVEIAATTLAQDRTVKRKIYAEAGIAVYWIVNLNSGAVEVFSEPRDGDYGAHAEFFCGDAIPVVLRNTPSGQVSVADLLP